MTAWGLAHLLLTAMETFQTILQRLQASKTAPISFGTKFSAESGNGERISKQRQRGKSNYVRRMKSKLFEGSAPGFAAAC